MPTSLFLKKIVPSSNSLVNLILPLTTGIALGATTMFAAPAKALPVVIDDFTNPTTPLTVVDTNSSSSTAASITGSDLSGVTRSLSLSATRLTGGDPNLTSSIDINPGTVALSTPSDYSTAASLNYNFDSTDLTADGNDRFAFSIRYDFATSDAPVSVAITANNTQTQTFTFTSGNNITVPLTFLFSDFTDQTVFASLTSLVVRLSAGNSNDVNIRTPIRAVPVPPAVVGTLMAAGLAAVSVAKKKKAELTEKSEA